MCEAKENLKLIHLHNKYLVIKQENEGNLVNILFENNLNKKQNSDIYSSVTLDFYTLTLFNRQYFYF